MYRPYRFLRNHSVYALVGVKYQEAYGGCARLSSLKSWSLWYMRPKIHMMGHVVTHGCILLDVSCVTRFHDLMRPPTLVN